ncbi:MAG: amino acid adenylation domain-containing protein [Tatlockia sp.]|nr:amino acid adenylation domain-containing protein [Tatlockia sp.]
MNHSKHSKKKADVLIQWLRNYATKHIDSYLADMQGSFPPHVFLDIGNQGFFGMHISCKYGGLELNSLDMLRIIEQFAAIDLTLTTVIIESIQGAHTLEKYASASMKEQYLNKLAKGDIFMAGAMTESAAGSNPRAMKSLAIPIQNDKWQLRGSKRWVGMAASAELIAVYVQQVDSNNNWVGMNGFLLPKGIEGLHIGDASTTMGLRGFAKHTIYLEDIEVSPDNLLGKPGEGMEIAQNNMMFIRLCLAAAGVGAMKRCVQLMSCYAGQRTIATGLLLENPVTLVHLSEMTAIIDSIDNLVYTVSSFYDTNPLLVPEEAFVVAKILSSEYLGIMADRLVQTLGARGYEEKSGISQLFRDARVFRIFEGPTEALTMYLGSRVIGKSLDLELFISKTLKQNKLVEEIKSFIEIIQKNKLKNRNLFIKPFAGDYWIQALIGDIISYGLLLAITEYSVKTTNSPKLHRALIWTRNKYNEVVQKSLALSLGEQVLIPSSEIKEVIANYANDIGYIEQVRSIPIDELLKKQKNNPYENTTEFQPVLKAPSQLTESNPVDTNQENCQQAYEQFFEKETIPNIYVYQLFEQQAALTPHAVAVTYLDEKITYKELNAKANRIAHCLINKGVGANKIVAIYIERSVEMIVGLLGILKAGGAYLPLDFNYPKKSLEYMFENSGSDIVLSCRKLENKIPFKAKNFCFIEDFINNPSIKCDENIEPNVNLENLGYLIYTSGSTGKPKGAMLPHKALTNLIHWHKRKIPETRNVLQFTALSFDMSFLEIFSALVSGGVLTLISEEARMNPWQFSKVINHNNIQQLVLPVSFLKTLVSTPLEKKNFSTLKEIIIAGEQLVTSPEIVSFFSQLSSCKLLNYYGPSETHVVTSYEFPENTTDWPNYPPIGRPIFNTKLVLLNEQNQLVRPGEVGEIYIGGAALAKGYINNIELTTERFISVNSGDEKEEKLYKTGDSGKFLPDGNFLFLGRKDEQLKIRGFRIEPKEIELHLTNYPGIKEAVVVAKKDAGLENHLEAFIVIESHKNDKLINLMYSFLQERVPPYMIPSVFNIIERMPLTDSGKIDRKQLEKYNKSIPFSINKIEAPQTSTEKALIDIMEKMFNFRIGINNSFSTIGGNSLLAMQIVSKLRNEFSIELPACAILSDPKLADTARRIETLVKLKSEHLHTELNAY